MEQQVLGEHWYTQKFVPVSLCPPSILREYRTKLAYWEVDN